MEWENAIFGPGWVWSMLSMVLVVGSLLGLYRQLRLQASQAAIDQLERLEKEYASERMARHSLDVLLALRDGIDPADLPRHAAVPVMNYWERVGSLARRGHLDMDLLWEGGSGYYCQGDWVMLAPAVLKSRAEAQWPELGVHFEWLVGQMIGRALRTGQALDDAAKQAARRDRAIAAKEETIRTEEALRSVVITAPAVVTPAPVISPAPAEG